MPEVKFTVQSYYNAAQEHLVMATELLEAQQYFAAHYFSGVAIEAILRAYGGQAGETFDSSHSLEYWADRGELAPKRSDKQNAFYARIAEANLRWRANQRYMTPAMLHTYLHSIKLDRIRGDRVKYSANRLLEIADIVVGQGVSKWKKS